MPSKEEEEEKEKKMKKEKKKKEEEEEKKKEEEEKKKKNICKTNDKSTVKMIDGVVPHVLYHRACQTEIQMKL